MNIYVRSQPRHFGIPQHGRSWLSDWTARILNTSFTIHRLYPPTRCPKVEYTLSTTNVPLKCTPSNYPTFSSSNRCHHTRDSYHHYHRVEVFLPVTLSSHFPLFPDLLILS